MCYATGMAVIRSGAATCASSCGTVPRRCGRPTWRTVAWEDGRVVRDRRRSGPSRSRSLSSRRKWPRPAVRSSAAPRSTRRRPARRSRRTSAISRSTRKRAAATVVRYTAIQDVGTGRAPELRRRADAGRRRAGHRLGAERGVRLRRGRRDGERRLPRLPDAGRVGSADDRHGASSRCRTRSHPYGVRGVGEVPIVPPLAAVANAMRDATGVRFTELPLSPPRVSEGLLAGRD